MSIFSMIDHNRLKKTIHVSKDLDSKSWTGRSRYVWQSDFEVIENIPIEEFDKMFDNYHNWCWGKGLGNCYSCMKHYRQLRLAKKINEKYKLVTGKNLWE